MPPWLEWVLRWLGLLAEQEDEGDESEDGDGMAITVTDRGDHTHVSGTSSGSSASFSATEGNILVVAVATVRDTSSAAPTLSVTDSFASVGSWTAVSGSRETTSADGPSGWAVDHYWAPVNGSGSGAVTVQITNGASLYGVMFTVFELAGVDLEDPVGLVGTNLSGSGTSFGVNIGGTPEADSVLTGIMEVYEDSGSVASPPSGWTETLDYLDGSTTAGATTGYINGSGAQTSTWTSISSGASIRMGSVVEWLAAADAGQDITPAGATVTVTPGTVTVAREEQIAPAGASVTVTPGTLTVAQSQPITLTGASVSVTPGAVSVQQTWDYTDDFNRSDGGVGSDYTAVSGFNGLEIVSNTIQAPTEAYYFSLLTTGTTDDDQIVEATVALGSDFSEAQIAVRCSSDASAYYYLQYTSASGGTIALRRFTGTATTIDGPITGVGSGPFTFRVSAVGTSIAVTRDGTPVLSATDGTITAGNAGLLVGWGGGSTPTVDDFALFGWEAGQDVTLTGASVSVTPGTVTVAREEQIAPAGASVTVTPGTVTVAREEQIAPAGASVSVTPGTLTVTEAQAISVTGATVSVTPGTLSVVREEQIAPVGASVTVTPGTVTIAGDQPVTLTGASVSVTPGTLTIAQGLPISLDGATVTVTPGTVTVAREEQITLTGATVTVTPGTVTVAREEQIAPAGASVTVTPGSLTVDLAVALTGASVTVTPGALTIQGDQPVTLTGASVSVAPGAVTVTIPSTAIVMEVVRVVQPNRVIGVSRPNRVIGTSQPNLVIGEG